MNRRQNRRSGCRSHSSMKPGFALSLSFEGLTLLHRSASGWRRVGEVAVDTPDMAAAMQLYADHNYDGLIDPDHAPVMETDTQFGRHRGYAFAIGYMTALKQVTENSPQPS